MKKFLVLVLLSLAILNLHAQVNGDNDTIWTTKFMTEGYPIIAYCFDAKFSPNGNSILAGIGYNIFEFEVQTGALIRKFDSCCPASENPDNILRNIDFSEDKKYVVTSFGTPHLWDYQTGKQIKVIHECGVAPKFLFDNNKWIMACGSNLKIYNWAIESIEKESSVDESLNGEIILTDNAFTLSKDKKYVALAYNKEDYKQKVWKNHLTLWDAEKLILIKKFSIVNGYDREGATAVISDNNKYVGFKINNVAYIYDLQTGDLINTFPVLSFNFIGNSDLLAYGTVKEDDIYKTKVINLITKEPYYVCNYKSAWSIDFNNLDNIVLSTRSELTLLNSNWKSVGVNENPGKELLDTIWYSKGIINIKSNFTHEVPIRIVNHIGQIIFSGLAQPISTTQQFHLQLVDGVYFTTYEITGRQYSQKFYVIN